MGVGGWISPGWLVGKGCRGRRSLFGRLYLVFATSPSPVSRVWERQLELDGDVSVSKGTDPFARTG